MTRKREGTKSIERIGRTALSVLLSLALAVGMCPMLCAPAYATEDRLEVSSDWTLTEDHNGAVTVTGDITIDLNGHDIIGDGESSVIIINNGHTLTLTDSAGGGSVTGGGGDTGGGVQVCNDSVFIMNGGTISGNRAVNAGGVAVSGAGSFTMSGGTISGNNATNGAGVYSSGTFTMTGGRIDGNTASYGGGVIAQSGSFNMSGSAEITNNSARHGGGIYAATDVVINGGSISGNTAGSGGGAYITDSGSIILSGGSVEANSAYSWSGGGIYNAGTLVISGGSVDGNSALIEGGGVYSYGELEIRGGSVQNNTAGMKGFAGVCAQGGTFTLSGNPVINGNTHSGSEEDICLYPSVTIAIQSALTMDNTMSVRRTNSDGNNNYTGVVAQGSGGYVVTEADASRFVATVPIRIVKYVDSKVQINPRFRVYYDANGGSGTAPSDEIWYEGGDTVTVKATNGVTPNYGWTRGRDGSGTVYAEGDTFEINNSATLYAKQSEDLVATQSMLGRYIHIPAYFNNPNTSRYTQLALSGDEIYVRGTSAFLWPENRTGDPFQLNAISGYIKLRRAHEGSYSGLYISGEGTEETKILRYNHNGVGEYGLYFSSGSGTQADPYVLKWNYNRPNGTDFADINPGDAVNGLDVDAISDTTITFVAATGRSVKFSGDDTYYELDPDNPTTFMGIGAGTKIYVYDSFNIRYDGNGESGGSTSASAAYPAGSAGEVGENGFTKELCRFLYWNTEPDGSGVRYYPGDKIASDTGVTLYAQWELYQYRLSYDGNGSDSGSVASAVAEFGHAINAAANGFNKSRYIFAGWNTEPDGSGQPYAPGDSVVSNSNLTLYAQWEVNSLYSFSAPLNVNLADGWNATAGITVSPGAVSFPAGNKLVITAESAGSFKVTNGAAEVSYTLKSAEGGSAVTSWEFSGSEVAAGTTKPLGIQIEIPDNLPVGTFTDTITFKGSYAATMPQYAQELLEYEDGGDYEFSGLYDWRDVYDRYAYDTYFRAKTIDSDLALALAAYKYADTGKKCIVIYSIDSNDTDYVLIARCDGVLDRLYYDADWYTEYCRDHGLDQDYDWCYGNRAYAVSSVATGAAPEPFSTDITTLGTMTVKLSLHEHEWTYTASGAAITAACTADCNITDGLTLTLLAPENLEYNGSVKTATLSLGSNAEAFPGPYEITYEKDGIGIGTAGVTNAGEYTAKVTIGGATAEVDFTIEKAAPTYVVPTGLTAIYGQTLNDVALPDGWSWQDVATTSVGNVGSNSFTALYTPDDTANYNTATETLTVTVEKANPAYVVPTGLTATYGQTLNDVALSDGWSWQDAVATSVGNVGSNSFTALYTPDDTANYNTATATVSVTVGKADNQITYAETQSVSKSFSASQQTELLAEATGGEGAVTYSIQSQKNRLNSDVAYFTLSGTTLTIAANTPVGEYTLTVRATAAGNENYNSGTKDSTVTVAIGLMAPTVTEPVVTSDITYNKTEQPLITAGTTADGTVWYRLGEDGTWSQDVPKAKDAGSYTVYYYIAGDENHSNIGSEANPVLLGTVEIAQKEAALSWESTAFAYDGSSHVPIATVTNLESGDICNVTVAGGRSEVGTHTATAAALSNPNYKLPADTAASFTVSGAKVVNNDGSPVTAPKRGNTLKAVLDPTDDGGTYRWYRDDTAIDGATDKTYQLTSDDVGKSIKVVIMKDTTTFTSASVGPVAQVHDIEAAVESGIDTAVTLKLKKGAAQIGGDRTITLTGSGPYTGTGIFTDVPDGIYNIVATQGSKTVTVAVTLSVTETTKQVSVTMPSGNVNSELDVKNDGVPAVVAAGLDQEAEDNRVANQSVTIKMTVKDENAGTTSASAIATEANQVDTAGNGAPTMTYMDISVTKQVGTAAAEPVHETRDVIELIVPFEKLAERTIWMWRNHLGSVQTLVNNQSHNDGTFWTDAANNLIHVYAQKYSVYAIGYVEAVVPTTAPSTSGSKSSKGSSGNVTTGAVTTGAIEVQTPAAITVASPAETGVADWLITDEHIAFLNGYNEDGVITVRPEGYINRAEVAAIFYRLLKNRDVAITKNFYDIPDYEWYVKEVGVLSSLGILTGYEEGDFRPQNFITRAEFAAIATRFAKATGGKADFLDVPLEHWAYGNVATASDYGWVSGYGDGSFGPEGNITRAEVAAIVNRMLGRSADKTYISANRDKLKSFSDLQNPTMWYYYDIIEASNAHDFTLQDGKETWTGK